MDRIALEVVDPICCYDGAEHAGHYMNFNRLTALPAAIVVASTLSQCESTARFGGNPDSYHRSKEHVEVTVIEGNLTPPETPQRILGVGPILAAELGVLVVDGVKYLLSEEAKRYSASYTGRATPSAMIDNVGNLTFGGFSMTRTVEIEKSVIEAMKGSFTVVASEDRTAFRILPNEVTVSKSKAKLRAGDNDVDLIIKVSINVIAPSSGSLQSRQLCSTSFAVKGFELGTKKTFDAAAAEASGSDWIPFPFSANPDHRFPYSLTVEVQETDDFGKWFDKIAARVEANRTEIIKAVQSGTDR